MKTLFQELLRNAPAVTDGAWGTQLQEFGLAVGDCPEVWNLKHPARVEVVARDYVEAGSRVILTNSFGGNRFILGRHGHENDVREINRCAVEISRRAAGARAFVFASIGPSGKLLMSGDVTKEELRAAFEEQAHALAEGGAHALVVETMSDPIEAAIAVRAAAATGLPTVGCMVFDSGRGKDRTMMGTTVPQAVAAMTEAGADAVGANCGQGIAGFVDLCRQFREATDLPIWIKANAGLPEMTDGRAVYNTSPEAFASHVPALIEAGASFIGGCCGTTPDFIRTLQTSLSKGG